jgi:protein-L-isoaspartate(D-aspartate) O-methyltransferase
MTDFAVLRQRMVDNQLRTSGVTDRAVLQAFLAVPREEFVASEELPFAYAERELRMAGSRPERRMMESVKLGRLINALPLGPDTKAMVIGCGTGYSAAILSRLAGSVIAVEDDAALAALAREKLQAVSATNIFVIEARLTEGCPSRAPYDAILVDGAVEAMPDALAKQLKPTGILAVIERDERLSRGMLYTRVGDETTKRPQFDAWAAVLPGFERPHEFVF